MHMCGTDRRGRSVPDMVKFTKRGELSVIAFYKRWRLRRKLRQAIDIARKRREYPFARATLSEKQRSSYR